MPEIIQYLLLIYGPILLAFALWECYARSGRTEAEDYYRNSTLVKNNKNKNNPIFKHKIFEEVLALTKNKEMVWKRCDYPDFFWNILHHVFHANYEGLDYILHFSGKGSRWIGVIRKPPITKLLVQHEDNRIEIEADSDKLNLLWSEVENIKVGAEGAMSFALACLD